MTDPVDGPQTSTAETKRKAARTPVADEAVIRTIAMPADTNPAGDIFGGWLVAQMDLAAGSAAARRAQGRCVTVSIDRVIFCQPVHVGDEVSVYAGVESIGRTSMHFQVEAWRRSRDGHEQHLVCEAKFSFVAIDSGGRPRMVPGEVPLR